ncbi:MAG: hypothetical protein SFU98_02660 [Leptospiraceae bacterium]|nr:hypothetical protein [Leptospiraceae bacterium]
MNDSNLKTQKAGFSKDSIPENSLNVPYIGAYFIDVFVIPRYFIRIMRSIKSLGYTFLKLLFGCIIFTNQFCSRIKISELRPSLSTKLEFGTEIDQLDFKQSPNSYSNLPIQIGLNSGRIFFPDMEKSIIKVFYSNGNLDYVIGNLPSKETFQRFYPIKLSNIGIVEASESDEIYIQNRVKVTVALQKESPELAISSGYFAPREMVFAPSYIFSISRDKSENFVIGEQGRNSIPFEYIESISAGEAGKLFVVHRRGGEYILSYFENGGLRNRILENSIKVFTEKEDTEYKISLEKFLPSRQGDFVYVCFGFTGVLDGRFKFRRIYKMEYGKLDSKILIKEFQDPSEVLFSMAPNSGFYLWETEKAGTIKLLLHDKDGNHIKNIRLILPSQRNSFRETFTRNDKIYSVKLDSEALEIYEWK